MFDHSACKTCPLNVAGGIAGTYMYRTADDEASVVVVTPSVPRPQELRRLQRIIDEFEDSELDYTFATKCTGDTTPKKQKPKKRAEQRHCRAASEEWQPDDRIYVCMGAEAVAAFTSDSVAKTMFGRVIEVTSHDGQVFKILPTVTLPQVFFYKESQQTLVDHINLALDHIQGQEVKFIRPETRVYEQPEDVLAYLESLILQEPSIIACDTETNSLNQYVANFEILMMSFSQNMNIGHTIILPGEFSNEPWTPSQEKRLFKLLAELFESKKHRWVFHNASYDTKALARFLELDIHVFDDCVDTMLLAHLTNENRSALGLKPLAREELNFEVWDKEVRDWFQLPMKIALAVQELAKVEEEVAQRYKTHKQLTQSLENKLEKAKLKLDALREESDAMLDDVKVYAAVDAAATFGLWEKFSQQIEDDPWLMYFFKQFLRVYPSTLSAVEHSGIKIDEVYFYEYRAKVQRHLAKIDEAFKKVYFEEFDGPVFVNEFSKAYSATDKNDKEFRKTLRDFKKVLERDTSRYQFWTLDDILDELAEVDQDFSDKFETVFLESWTLRDQHIEELIRNHFDLPILAKTPTGQLSLTADVVDEYIEHTTDAPQAFFRLYKIHSDLSKNLSTYINGFLPYIDDEFFLHGNLNASGTLTGRISSRNPNLQNIKKTPEVLQMFTSRFGKDGLIVSADYSQAELRKLAVVSQDAGFLAAYRFGIDLHRLTAAKTFQLDIPNLYNPEVDPDALSKALNDQIQTWQRNLAKTINFGIVYGMQSQGFSRQTGYSEDEAEAFIATYFENAPGILKWIRLTELFSLYHAYSMSPLGRKRRIPNFIGGDKIINDAFDGAPQEIESYDSLLDAMLDDSDFDANATHQIIEFVLSRLSRDIPINILRKDLRAAVNAPIQGGASDLNLRTLYRLQKKLRKRGFQSQIVSTVHDNIIVDTHVSETRRVVEDLHKIAIAPFPKKIWEAQLRGYEKVPFEIEVKIGVSQANLEEVSLPEYYLD